MIFPYKKVKRCLPYNNLQVFNVCVQFSYTKELTVPSLKQFAEPLININHSIRINTFRRTIKRDLRIVLVVPF